MGFGTDYELRGPSYAERCNYGTVGHCVPDTEVNFSRRNFFQVGPIATGQVPLDST
jgi:hypothetical protein